MTPLPDFNPDAMPHRPPMRMVDALLEAGVAASDGADESPPLPHGIAAFRVCPGNVFVDGAGAFAREALAEVMAQAFMAVSVHLAAQAGERVPGGYLAGMRGIRFADERAACIGDTLLAQVRATDQIAQVAIVRGRVFCHEICEENLLAEGELRLYTLPAEALPVSPA